MSFYWRRRDDGPSSYFPEDGDRWFWPKHGVQIGRTLVIFYSRIKLKPGEPCCFNFEGDGWRAAIVDDASGDPDQWTVRVVSPPEEFSDAVPEAVNVVGDYAVSLAVSDDFTGHLVRWRLDDLAAGRLDAAEWWAGSRGWVTVSELDGPPERIIDKVGPEASLHFEAELDRWVLVWTEGFGAATVVVSFAPRIEGPWSKPTEVYRPPEGDRPGNLIYAGKGHPELDGADLAVTYVASTAYYPRFVKLTFSARPERTRRRRLLQQAVADAPDVDDEAVAVGKAELLPETRGMRLEGSGSPKRPEPPDLPQKLLLREDSMRLGGQSREEIEFLRRERHGSIANGHTPGASVDHEVAGDQHLGRRGRAPAQERADARQQLLVRERPPHHVVRAAIEGTHALDEIRRGSEQDHRHVPVPRPSGLSAAEAQAEVELGEENEIRTCTLREVERLASARRAEHVEPVVLELAPEVFARL